MSNFFLIFIAKLGIFYSIFEIGNAIYVKLILYCQIKIFRVFFYLSLVQFRIVCYPEIEFCVFVNLFEGQIECIKSKEKFIFREALYVGMLRCSLFFCVVYMIHAGILIVMVPMQVRLSIS